MRFRLRTLLILLAILPPILAAGWWQYSAWQATKQLRAERARAQKRAAIAELELAAAQSEPGPYFPPGKN